MTTFMYDGIAYQIDEDNNVETINGEIICEITLSNCGDYYDIGYDDIDVGIDYHVGVWEFDTIVDIAKHAIASTYN